MKDIHDQKLAVETRVNRQNELGTSMSKPNTDANYTKNLNKDIEMKQQLEVQE